MEKGKNKIYNYLCLGIKIYSFKVDQCHVHVHMHGHEKHSIGKLSIITSKSITDFFPWCSNPRSK